jgi:pullulanase/glycogen debranching enzyme
MVPGAFFYTLRSDLPLGALVRGDRTVFRLFAPRATAVTLEISADPAGQRGWQPYALHRRADADGAAGIWETTLDRDLHGWCYGYRVAGDAEGAFDPSQRLLDPYAWAVLGPQGPGVVVNGVKAGRADRSFRTPAWQDLIIVEAHVRDLAALAPTTATAAASGSASPA